MENIYVVTMCYLPCSEPVIEAAFSTRETAEALAEALLAQTRHENADADVEEVLFDPDWVKGFYVIVELDRKGTLVEEPKRHVTLDPLPFQAIVGFDETRDGLLYLSHFAATRDVDAAVEQTNHIREQAISLGYWPDESLPSHDFESLLDAGRRLGGHLGVRFTERFRPTEGGTAAIGGVIF